MDKQGPATQVGARMALRSVNLGLRFFLELCALAALAYWGANVGGGRAAQIGTVIVAPLGAAIVWGLFVAPAARVRLPERAKFILGLIVLATAAIALAVARHPVLATVFFVIAAINAVLLHVLAPK